MTSHAGKLLSGVKVVTLALNTPGPVAAARLASMGAEVAKVEPPAGDPLKTAAPGWYHALANGAQAVVPARSVVVRWNVTRLRSRQR